MSLRIASTPTQAEPSLSQQSQLPKPRNTDPKWKAALDFESMFLGQLMKGMRQSIQTDESGQSSQERQMFTEMLDQQYASLSSRSPAHLDLHAPEHAKSGALKSLAAQIYRSMIRHDQPLDEGDIDGKNPATFPMPTTPNAPSVPFAPWYKPEARSTQLGPVQLDSDTLNDLAKTAGQKYGIPPELIRSVIQTESAGHSHAVSQAGAKGLMQLMDTTAADLGVDDSFDPKANVDGGTRYLKGLLQRFDGDMEKALAGYNAGPGAVEKHGGIPPYPETQNYVKRVMQGMRQFSHLANNLANHLGE